MKTKKTFWQRMKSMGPAAVIAAAVIGPGSVTSCSMAGYSYGQSLGWAIIFAVLAAVVTQIITSKISTVTGKGLSDNIREIFTDSKWKWPITILLIVTVAGGNIAFEASNIVGSSVGASIFLGEHRTALCLAITAIAAVLLFSGNLRIIEVFLTALILLMAAIFTLTAIVVKPDVGELLKGMFIPTIPSGAQIVAMGLIGTTLATTNVFLYASSCADIAAKGNLKSDEEIEDKMIDHKFDISINGILTALISIAIITVGASLARRGESVEALSDVAKGLEPLVGNYAKLIFALGIFSAGVSSSITCPMGAAYVVTGLLGWETNLKNPKFKMVLAFELLLSCFFAITGGAPTNLIIMAQSGNGIFLPICIVLLFYISNRKDKLGKYANGKVMNVLFSIVLLVTLMMAGKTFYTLFFS